MQISFFLNGGENEINENQKAKVNKKQHSLT